MTPRDDQNLDQRIERDRLLTRIDANVDNLVKNFEKHVASDQASFDKQAEEIGWLKSVVYCGLGGLAVVEIFLKFIK